MVTSLYCKVIFVIRSEMTRVFVMKHCFAAQWRRQTVDATCKRRMCNKPLEGVTEGKPAVPAQKSKFLTTSTLDMILEHV